MPSGFVWQDQWKPRSCALRDFDTSDKISACLTGKLIYLLGDSTGRQWIESLTRRVTSLQYLDSHGFGKHRNLIAVDLARNIQIQWKKHHHPLVTASEYGVNDHNYIAREIDGVAGDKDTAIVLAIGQHFRPFPLPLFLRRAINVRSAVQRLLLRSPGTKVLVKGENIREMGVDQERFSDFHGHAQDLAAKEVFQGLDVAFIDAWEMTTAYGTSNVHPPEQVVWNQVNMFLNYIC